MANSPRNENEEAGKLAGFGAGTLTGAKIGSALIPVPFLGTFTGALIGGALGSRLGQRLGPPILGVFDSLLNPKPSVGQPARSSSIPITIESGEAGRGSDLLAQLERLGKLREQGLLTEEEFAAAKAQLLQK